MWNAAEDPAHAGQRLAHLDPVRGAAHAADPPDLAQLRERGVAATRQLAKRQITWLRSMAHRRVVEADADDVEARLVAIVAGLIGPAGAAPAAA